MLCSQSYCFSVVSFLDCVYFPFGILLYALVRELLLETLLSTKELEGIQYPKCII